MSCEDIPSLADLQNTKKHVDDFGRLMGTGEGDSTNEVTGQVRPTYNKVMKSVGFKPGSGDFTTGFTVLPGQYDIAWRNPTDNNWYSYLGVIPSGGYTVAPGTIPVGSSLWKPVTDETLRLQLADPDGVTLVGNAVDSRELSNPTGVDLVGGAAKETEVAILQQNFNRSMAVLYGQLVAGTAQGSKIHFFGDSTMWGSNPEPNTTTQQATNPPAMFKIALDILYPGNGVSVTNKAIPGSALYSLLRGINHYFPTSYEQMLQADHPTIAYMGHCLNDCSSADGETNINQYYSDLVTFVDITRKYGAVPVFVTPAMHAPLGSGTVAQTKRQESFIQAMRDVAAKKEVDLVDSSYYMKRSIPLWRPADIAPDGVHLSPMFSSQHGFNMLIPLVRAETLKAHGDIAGLNTTVWQDNLPSVFNKITNKPDTEMGPTLLGEGTTSQLKINFPVILDSATRHNFIALGGYSWSTHGVSSITYFDGYGTSGVLSGNIDASTVNASDRALFAPSVCRLPAGLAIIGVNFPANTQIGKAFSFAGVKLLDRVFSGHGVLSQPADTVQRRDILVGDTITTSGQLNPGSPLLILNEAYYPTKVAVNIYWKTSSNAVVIDCQGTSTTIWTTPPDNEMFQMDVIIEPKGLIVKIGGLSKTVSGLANNHPRMCVSNVTPYTVNRPV